MTWLTRYKLRRQMSALWLPPTVAMIFAMAGVPLVRHLDTRLGWTLLGHSPDGARLLLGALTTSTLTFLVFVFTILLVAIQFASVVLTPRLTAIVLNDRLTKLALCTFVFSFFCRCLVGAHRRTRAAAFDGGRRRIELASVLSFLLLLDHVGRMLRPATLIARTVAIGRRVIADVYPETLTAARGGPSGSESGRIPSSAIGNGIPPATLARRGPAGVLLAIDVRGLTELARRADCVIELIPQVGDFVATGEPLFRVYGPLAGAAATPGVFRDSNPVTAETLRAHVALGTERTLQQDSAFVFRLLVDVALKALSPAVNDPTTAVTAVDQLHRLLALVGQRHLNNGDAFDPSGALRFRHRTPSWEDFVALAVTEVRQFGAASIQVARRLRAMLESLERLLPPSRAAALQAELELLKRAVKREFRDAEDRSKADAGDEQGLGGTAGAVESSVATARTDGIDSQTKEAG